MGVYHFNVIIENKPSLRDPEGEVILRDLMIKNGFECVKKVRVAKLLRLEVEGDNETQARGVTIRMCNDLRLFNPVISICTVNSVSE